jgi:hypothetical protein
MDLWKAGLAQSSTTVPSRVLMHLSVLFSSCETGMRPCTYDHLLSCERQAHVNWGTSGIWTRTPFQDL